MRFPVFLLLFLCLNLEQNSFSGITENKIIIIWFAPQQFAACLPVRDLPPQKKHDNNRIFSVPNVDLLCSKCSAVLQLICIAIIMEWRGVETSKTLSYLRTVTCRDAPIQIKYHHWTKFPKAGLYMACGNQHTKEFQIPVTNMSYISITLSSDNKIMEEL